VAVTDCGFQSDGFQNDGFQVCVTGEDAAGWLLMHAPVRRRPLPDDDEDELLAWYFLEVMDD
jgi:hypothetical protein